MATTTRNPNPRRKLEGEPLKKKPMAMIRQIDLPDPQCMVHQKKPFARLFPTGRPLTRLDFQDLDPACTCIMERYEGDGKPRKIREAKVCTKCHLRRAKNGTCGCD